MRAALYARFSTDLQSAASIPDQLRVCRRHAEGLGAEVVAEFSDAAISGRAMGNRPGVLELMAAARSGRFDVVVAEHMDRLSRSGGDSWAIFEDLRAAGVEIHTANQGAIGAMHVGLSGTMSALLIEETARKVRRGLEGVTRDGRSAGGLSYGYRKVIRLDGRGEPIRGLREIAPEEGAVVERIYLAYAAGRSPRGIAEDLNAEGVPGPSGGPWNASTISGNAARGNGVLHNELYQGVIVWGRNAWIKDRVTGKRRSRAGAEPAIVRQDAPELRIVSDELWAAVRARHAGVKDAAKGGRPEGARRPKRLLSGLLRCGTCGGRLIMAGTVRTALRCQTRAERGKSVCSNTRAPGYAGVEGRVLAAVQANLLHPAVVEAAVREFEVQQARRDGAGRRKQGDLQRELAEVRRRCARLVDQVADGALEGKTVGGRLRDLETRGEEIERMLEAAPPPSVRLLPSAPARYRKLAETLTETLDASTTPERMAARDALRALITEVRVQPLPAHGAYALELVADLEPLLQAAPEGESMRMNRGLGAGARITRRHTSRFEVRLSA